MSILHTVNKSPFEKNSLESCLRVAGDSSAVLLLEDGVLGALDQTRIASQVKANLGRIRFYVLEPDLRARGLDPARVIHGITSVNYDGFVDLAVEHDKIQAWL